MLLSELLSVASDRNASAVAVVRGDRQVTYGELYRDASRVAYGLQMLGLRAGDRVAILGHPTIDLVIALHAAAMIGVIPSCVVPSYARAEVQAIVDDLEPAAIVYDATQSELVQQLAYRRQPVVIDETKLAELIRHHESLAERHRPSADDVALVVYTGATTGRPKGVMHTHGTIANWFGMTGTRTPEARALLFNIAYGSGQNTVWASAFNRSCIVLFDRYPATAEDIIAAIERDRVTNLAAISTAIREIVRLPGIEERDLSSVKSVVVGGMPISPQMLLRAAEVFSHARVFHNYGITECGNVTLLPVALARHRPERLRSVGHPGLSNLLGIPPCELRIVDTEARDVPSGVVGEILVRSQEMMIGYWNNPAATAAALRDGWFHTGDLGHFDEHGYLYIVDRMHDTIVVVNATVVYSSEVEVVLEKHPAVLEAAVVGTPHDEYERITAFAVLQPGTTLSLAELQNFCADQIARWKTPTQLILVEELPRTNIGKTNKAELRTLAASHVRE